MNLEFVSEIFDGLKTNYLQFQNGSIIVKTFVSGKIINSVPSNSDKELYVPWKRKVAKSIYDNMIRGKNDPDYFYAVSLSMRFYPKDTKGHKLDVENYAKPIIDGIAKGLFSNDPNFENVQKFNEDDSNFRYLYIERIQDATNESERGVKIVVSKINRPVENDS
jgi:Holliday junction resolvase RusA-like endonuclease